MAPRLRRCLRILLPVALSLYLGEAALSLVLVKTLRFNPLPPRKVQTHATRDYRVTYRTNNVGHRGPDLDAAVDYDLVLLGDSFLFGMGVPQESTVQARLRRRGLEVLNLSETATNPVQYLHKLQVAFRLGLSCRRVAVGLFVGNDFQGVADRDISALLDFDYGSFEPGDTVGGLLALSRIRYLLGAAATRLAWPERLLVHDYQRRKRFRAAWTEWYTDGDRERAEKMRAGRVEAVASERAYLERAELSPAAIGKVVRILERVASVARRHGARLLVIVIPDLHFARGELREAYAGRVAQFKDAAAPLDLLDLHGALAATGDDHYFEHDGHWNASGHAVAADALLGRLAGS